MNLVATGTPVPSARRRSLATGTGRAQRDALMADEGWVTYMMRAALHLQGSGHVRGVTGDAVMKRMELWTKTIPA